MRVLSRSWSVVLVGALVISGCTSESPTAVGPLGPRPDIASKLAKYDGKQLRFSTYAKGKNDLVPHLYSSERVSISFDQQENSLRIHRSTQPMTQAEPRDTFTTVLPVMWQEDYSEPLGDLWAAAVTDTLVSLDTIPVGYYGLGTFEVDVDSAPDARAAILLDRSGQLLKSTFDLGEDGAVGISEMHYDGNGDFTGLTVTVMFEGVAYITELTADDLSLEPTAESHRLAAAVLRDECSDAWMDLAFYGTVSVVEVAIGGWAVKGGLRAASRVVLEFVESNAGTAILPVSRTTAKLGLGAIVADALYHIAQPFYETFKAGRTLYRNNCF